MERRFSNKIYRKFVGITQFTVFSNNNEYDDSDIEPIQGAFYASSSYTRMFFSKFREQREEELKAKMKPIDIEDEVFILSDTNLIAIKGTPEYTSSINEDSPTNRIITSLYTKDRILFLLKYGICYKTTTNKDGITQIEKHIMRYPQMFATMAIRDKLREGVRKGVIWHTQGSGKTALAYSNVRYLTDYFSREKGKIAKFYFIVDRLDLAEQAKSEFEARGLNVKMIKDKKQFIDDIVNPGESNTSGKTTMTVLNIQKFSKESVTKPADYNVNVQRVYFLDAAHRSSNPTGSFLANLMSSDRNAVMIALTGTPLIGEGYNTKDVFGNYIHKYYYNQSIADGYTLKLIREEIETTYKNQMNETLDQIVRQGSIAKKELYAHPKFVEKMVDYIIHDFGEGRNALDSSIGAMIVCDSSEQAREVDRQLNHFNAYTHALILHDEGTKQDRKDEQEEFKKGNIDILVVYNMLLTGFDVPRLKKQYLARMIKAHNLLQTLTRVNRPYKGYHYGYVVDFANIKDEFDKTNKAYFDEKETVSLVAAADESQMTEYFTFRTRQGHKAIAFDDSSVILTEKTAEKLGLSVGDSFEVETTDGGRRSLTLTGITENYVFTRLYLSQAQLKTLNGGALPAWNAVYGQTDCPTDAARASLSSAILACNYVSSVSFIEDTTQMFDGLIGCLNYVVMLVIVCAAALAAVVLYNLISVNLGERKKELATIKVLGFYDKEVYRYIFREIDLLSLIGSLVGLVVGIPLHQFIIRTVEMDQMMFIRSIAPRSFVFSVALTMLFNFAVCLLMRRHVRQISMVESMKAPE